MFSARDGWCEDHVKFRDKPKDEDIEDDELREKLVPLQPAPFDPTTISDEAVTDVASLPGGNEPVVDPTPRCNEQETKKKCKALRYADTEFPLGGKYSERKACEWTSETDEDEDEEDESGSESKSDSEGESGSESKSSSESGQKKREKRCRAKDACGELTRNKKSKTKKLCKKFGAASRCVYEGGECFFDGE